MKRRVSVMRTHASQLLLIVHVPNEHIETKLELALPYIRRTPPLTLEPRDHQNQGTAPTRKITIPVATATRLRGPRTDCTP